MITLKVTENTIKDWMKKRVENLKTTEELFEKIGSFSASSIIRRIKEGVNPPDAPLTMKVKKSDKTLRDTGRLMSSISYNASANGAVVGTNVVYARIMHEGGKIKPKKARWLTVPASNTTRRLMRRYGETPKKCIDGMKSAGYKVFVPKGKHVIMAQRGKQKPFVLFILKKEVQIPSRKYMFLGETEKSFIRKEMRKWLVS